MKMSFIVSMGPSINDLKRRKGHKLTKKCAVHPAVHLVLGYALSEKNVHTLLTQNNFLGV